MVRRPILFMLCLVRLAAGETAPAAENAAGYVPLVRSHLDRLLEVGLDVYGPESTPMWLASIDVRRGGQYEGITAESRRVYRTIHAPRGSTLYWDQPSLVAAYLLTDLTGEARYAEAADRYLKEFLARCVSEQNGLFLWGNHLWYNVFTDKIETIGAPWHEARPIPPAWPIFWKIDPAATERAIRAMGRHHVLDPETGHFDRHADTRATTPRRGEGAKGGSYPFIEAGGVLAESLCWLAARRDGDEELAELALRIARFSFDGRHKATGLMRNQLGRQRWDYHQCTTEVGVWAASLLRAAGYSGRDEFRTMARDAMAAYLKYGFDEEAGKFFGALNVADGSPVRDFDATYPYRPDLHADPWEPLFPTHDYPMAMAEACLDLYRTTGEAIFRQGALRWAEHLRNCLPPDYAETRRGQKRISGAYAGHYGRAIHFLARGAEVLDEPPMRRLAERLAAEAVAALYVGRAGMFRSNPARDTCDAVDEPGTLLLALLYLQTRRSPAEWGFHF